MGRSRGDAGGPASIWVAGCLGEGRHPCSHGVVREIGPPLVQEGCFVRGDLLNPGHGGLHRGAGHQAIVGGREQRHGLGGAFCWGEGVRVRVQQRPHDVEAPELRGRMVGMKLDEEVADDAEDCVVELLLLDGREDTEGGGLFTTIV